MVEDTPTKKEQISLGNDLGWTVPMGVIGSFVGAIGSFALPLIVPEQIKSLRKNGIDTVHDFAFFGGMILAETAAATATIYTLSTISPNFEGYMIPNSFPYFVAAAHAGINVAAGVIATGMAIYKSGERKGSTVRESAPSELENAAVES